MDYEQYLYGHSARDAARTGSRIHLHGRIGILILGTVLALVVLGSVGAIFGAGGVGVTDPIRAATGERAEAAGAPVTLPITLVVSRTPVTPTRR